MNFILNLKFYSFSCRLQRWSRATWSRNNSLGLGLGSINASTRNSVFRSAKNSILHRKAQGMIHVLKNSFIRFIWKKTLTFLHTVISHIRPRLLFFYFIFNPRSQYIRPKTTAYKCASIIQGKALHILWGNRILLKYFWRLQFMTLEKVLYDRFEIKFKMINTLCFLYCHLTIVVLLDKSHRN